VGTTDLHGFVFPRDGRGGLALLAGFVNNLRTARAADGGAVVLVDAGDTFQGGIESNLSEGALVVDAYNAMGYTAAAIGNHEFEFGPIDGPMARQVVNGDPRGALKARAAQARYPFLAANLVDAATGQPVAWPNVRPSVIVEAAGLRVGLIGVMTINAMRATLPVNVQGLRVTPLTTTVVTHAEQLRAAGADVVVLVAHAGGSCAQFDGPTDLSACDQSSEIFTLARSLPPGLVDVIAAGHTHDGIAHEVAGVAIVQAHAHGRAFARVDVLFDRKGRRILRTEIFAPRDVCARQDPETLSCDATGASSSQLPAARYEGRLVAADEAVNRAMGPALARVRDLQATPLGVIVDAPMRRAADPESAVGNLFADALRESLTGVDVAISNNWLGGLRADLPDGALTFGRLYDVFPFDNRVVRLTLTGDELRRVLADEFKRRRRAGTLAISGVQVKGGCVAEDPNEISLELFQSNGNRISGDERLVVATMDSLMTGLILAKTPVGATMTVSPQAPIVREVVEDWLRLHGGHIGPEQFIDPENPRWELAGMTRAGCLNPS
jgi:5'-nucleotidase